MVRRIVGSIIGIVAALIVISSMEMIDVWLFPIAAGIDVNDPKAVEALIAAMPAAALLVVTAGWFLGALFGGVVAIAVARWRWAAWAPALATLAGSVANLVTIHHPAWMAVAGIVLPPLAAPAAMAIARAR